MLHFSFENLVYTFVAYLCKSFQKEVKVNDYKGFRVKNINQK
jgi:hypothetical protein